MVSGHLCIFMDPSKMKSQDGYMAKEATGRFSHFSLDLPPNWNSDTLVIVEENKCRFAQSQSPQSQK